MEPTNLWLLFSQHPSNGHCPDKKRTIIITYSHFCFFRNYFNTILQSTPSLSRDLFASVSWPNLSYEYLIFLICNKFPRISCQLDSAGLTTLREQNIPWSSFLCSFLPYCLLRPNHFVKNQKSITFPYFRKRGCGRRQKLQLLYFSLCFQVANWRKILNWMAGSKSRI
jgi:hypothetical protein